MDRLQSMRVFVKVAEVGSFAGAGEALDISNPVVTRHIANLESHLGTRLLNRSTRSLSLTEAGLAYLERVRQILDEIDDADRIASSRSEKISGNLRLYSHVGIGHTQIAKLIPHYVRKFPDVVLDVTLTDRTVDLVEDGFDVGLFMDLQKFDASMIVRKIGISELLLCASPDYLKRHGVPRNPEELSQHSCLNFSHKETLHSWILADVDGGAVEIPITTKIRSNHGEVLHQCALAGLGIMILPSFAISDDLVSGRLVRVMPEYRRHLTVMMVYPSRRLLSATVRSFVDFINTQFPHPEHDPWLKDAATP